MAVRISVVVPTHNRPKLLKRCLAALAYQDLAREQYEVIVVDDGESVATRRVVEEAQKAQGLRCRLEECLRQVPVESAGWWASPTSVSAPQQVAAGGLVLDGLVAVRADRSDRHNGVARPDVSANPSLAGSVSHAPRPEVTQLRYLALDPARGPAAARNAGWRAAQGEIIAFTDDDCIPTPGWLRAGLEAFDDHRMTDSDVIGVSGQVVMPLPLQPTDFELNAAGLQRSEFVTANCFYRRAALAAVGGFDERFRAPWREDSDLFFTLVEHYGAGPASPCTGDTLNSDVLMTGRSGVFLRAPNAIVFHPVRPAGWGISLRQQRKSEYNALLYKKHPALYRQRLGPVVPWHYYGDLAALLATGIALLYAQRAIAALAAGVWLLLAGRFCLQRLWRTAHTPAHVAEMVITSLLIPPLAVFWRLVGAFKHRVWFL